LLEPDGRGAIRDSNTVARSGTHDARQDREGRLAGRVERIRIVD
jgi:hypothetical protein